MNKDTLDKAFNRAINGGSAGFLAMTGQVFSMMWLRTMVNYQYKNGGNFTGTFKTLYREGGIPRFYRGLSFALMQAPLSRFGDTAMNIGMNTLLEDSNLNIAQKTFAGSLGAGLWRIGIMPIDTCKSSLQVHGKDGMKIVKNKISDSGFRVLYHGSSASALSTVVGHFPWFYTYNFLNETFPKQNYIDNNFKLVIRSACIGFASSSISDITSNSFRVIKVNRQVSDSNIKYYELIKNIIKKESIIGLFTRGLKTKIITNGIQGMIFTILFDYLRK